MRNNARLSVLPRATLQSMIEGIAVYDPSSRKIGTIREGLHVPASRRSPYVIMSLGGCLGIGEDFRPVPRSSLRFNREKGAYEIALSEDLVRNAPIYTHESNWKEDRWASRVRHYYGVKLVAA